MTISIPRSELKEACQGISKIVSGKQSLPVLGCVRLRANDRQVVAEATDLDQLVEYRFDGAEVDGEGACILPVAVLKALAKGGKTEQVELDAQDPLRIGVTNHVRGSAVRQTVTGLALDEWPAFHVDVPTQPADGFLETYRRLAPFASTDETRHVLNSVFVEVGSGEQPVTMAATDGRRLACFNSMALPLKQSVVVPVTKFLGWSALGADVEIGVRDEDGRIWLGVRSGKFLYAVKTVDGTYPNYRQVIPAEPGEHVIAIADGDVELLKQVLPTLPGGDEIAIVGQDGHVTLYGRGPDDDRWSTLKLENTSYSGTRTFIGLNRDYILDALAAGFREFAITDELCPVLSRDNQGGTHVLMPMRVQDPGDTGDVKAATPGVRQDEPVTPPRAEPQHLAASDEAQPIEKKSKRRKTVAKQNEQKNEGPALDRVVNACDDAKTKVREAGQALTALSQAVKAFEREQKLKEREIEQARAAIKKVQALSLAA
jgi:DNA polymerase-3 subunit beta